jgi:hypothetical protein
VASAGIQKNENRTKKPGHTMWAASSANLAQFGSDFDSLRIQFLLPDFKI